MGREEQIIRERKRKLEELRKIVNPYPHKFDVKDFSVDIKEKNKKLKDDARTSRKVQVAGRVMTIRDLGKLIFVTIQDSKGRLQIILQKKVTSAKDFELFKKYVDVGDFVGCKGSVMKTPTLSARAEQTASLSK